MTNTIYKNKVAYRLMLKLQQLLHKTNTDYWIKMANKSIFITTVNFTSQPYGITLCFTSIPDRQD
jgi:hypothetical protein